MSSSPALSTIFGLSGTSPALVTTIAETELVNYILSTAANIPNAAASGTPITTVIPGSAGIVNLALDFNGIKFKGATGTIGVNTLLASTVAATPTATPDILKALYTKVRTGSSDYKYFIETYVPTGSKSLQALVDELLKIKVDPAAPPTAEVIAKVIINLVAARLLYTLYEEFHKEGTKYTTWDPKKVPTKDVELHTAFGFVVGGTSTWPDSANETEMHKAHLRVEALLLQGVSKALQNITEGMTVIAENVATTGGAKNRKSLKRRYKGGSDMNLQQVYNVQGMITSLSDAQANNTVTNISNIPQPFHATGASSPNPLENAYPANMKTGILPGF
jgi:hypothetical protein